MPPVGCRHRRGRGVGSPGGRHHADPGGSLLDGARRRAAGRAAPAPGLRARLLDRAPEGHQCGVRGISGRGRPARSRGRAALRRGRRRCAHPPGRRPLDRRSWLRAPPGRGSLMVRGARLLRLAWAPPPHGGRVGEGRAWRGSATLPVGLGHAHARAGHRRPAVQCHRGLRRRAARAKSLRRGGHAGQSQGVDRHHPPALSLPARRRPRALHGIGRGRGSRRQPRRSRQPLSLTRRRSYDRRGASAGHHHVGFRCATSEDLGGY